MPWQEKNPLKKGAHLHLTTLNISHYTIIIETVKTALCSFRIVSTILHDKKNRKTTVFHSNTLTTANHLFANMPIVINKTNIVDQSV